MFPLHNDGEQEAELLHLRSWEKDVLDGAHNLHFNFQKPYGKLMTKHGFKNIKSVVINSPLGQRTSQEMALERVEPYSLVPLIEGCGWTLTGVQVQNARVKRDIKSHRNYLSLQTYVALIPIVFALTYMLKNCDLWSEVACFLELPGPNPYLRPGAVECT